MTNRERRIDRTTPPLSTSAAAALDRGEIPATWAELTDDEAAAVVADERRRARQAPR